MRMRRKQMTTGFATRWFAGWLALFLVLCAGACEPEQSHRTVPLSEDVPIQAIKGMTLRESHGGKTRWVLDADSAMHYENQRTLLLGVTVAFYNDAGDSIRSWLSAREGEVDPHTRDLVARGSVVVRTRDGDRLETEELRYEQAIDKIVSDCFVRLTRGESVITGIGIETDAALKSYVICSDVEGDLYEEDQPPEGLER
ncbi:MAG: LPS export ABC transporter periplasmic protein LptC [Candidatus Eisenbacteria sp.]|nr:LPS export ABC transporter periplasmic protein LptC [Candidatus Eisenbacteria bacterium]